MNIVSKAVAASVFAIVSTFAWSNDGVPATAVRSGVLMLSASPKADGYFGEYSKRAVKEDVGKGASAIIVKGLFIGMSIHDVPEILRSKLDEGAVTVHDVAKGDAGKFPNALTRPENYYVAVGGLLPIGIVISGPDGKVNNIVFMERLVDVAFKAENMDVSSFAQEFVNAYNIPQMRASDDRKSWFYISHDGVKVSIYHDKTLQLQKVSSEVERKNSFN